MASIEKTVFISYRRKDRYAALAVYQHLTGQQYDVFLDYTSIPSGDFEQIIVSNIKARAHFVLILTPTTLDRCSEPGDWLRREIEVAIDEKRNIIPLFFDGFSFSAPGVPEKLTGKLGMIGRYNGLDIPPGYFTEAMERLSEKFLSVPLHAVIHPVPTDVRKVVNEEREAADQALLEKKQEIDKLVKPAKEKSNPPIRKESIQPVAQPTSKEKRDRTWRLFGISAGMLLAVALGITGINSLLQRQPLAEPTGEPPTPHRTSTPTTPAANTGSPPVVPALTQISESIIISGVDGMKLFHVPEGKFIMGSETGEIDESPVHAVFLNAFWIDQTEVTNAMYAKCVEDHQCIRPPRTFSEKQPDYYDNAVFGNYPVIHVSWNDAQKYCAWAGRRLPTEAEWEKAARGRDERTYPWGDTIPNEDFLNYVSSNKGDTTKVGSYPVGASPYGALDMAGNVLEWVGDRYSDTYYANSPLSNPSGPNGGENRVFRGGGWQQGVRDVRATRRYNELPTYTTRGLGFRCAYSP